MRMTTRERVNGKKCQRNAVCYDITGEKRWREKEREPICVNEIYLRVLRKRRDVGRRIIRNKEYVELRVFLFGSSPHLNSDRTRT